MVRLALISGIAAFCNISAKAGTVTPNNIDCSEWQKEQDGTWTQHQNGKPVSFGSTTDLHIAGAPVNPGAFRFNGIDLFEVLNAKCGKAVKSER
jgi:hypothetical protein